MPQPGIVTFYITPQKFKITPHKNFAKSSPTLQNVSRSVGQLVKERGNRGGIQRTRHGPCHDKTPFAQHSGSKT